MSRFKHEVQAQDLHRCSTEPPTFLPFVSYFGPELFVCYSCVSGTSSESSLLLRRNKVFHSSQRLTNRSSYFQAKWLCIFFCF